jgi:hypothetical protein
VAAASIRSQWERAFRSAQIAAGKHGTITVAVGFVFATYANPDGSNVYPSYEKIAAGLGKSPRTVSRAAQRLVAEEWLCVVREREPPYRMVTHYKLNIPSKWLADTTAESEQESAASYQGDSPDTSTRQPCPVTMSRDTTPDTTPETTNSLDHDELAAAEANPWFTITLADKIKKGEPLSPIEQAYLDRRAPSFYD